MSTGANYEFYSNGNLEARFYIHHDGYPEGAATYFHNALLKNGGRSRHSYFIDAFYKANANCEISPRLHGDIEYLYQFDVETEILTAKSINHEWDREQEQYIASEEIFYKGTVHKFVNENLTIFSDLAKEYENVARSYESEEATAKKIKKDNLWTYGTCLKLLKTELTEKVQTLNEYLFNMSADNTNIKSKTEEIENTIKKILAIKTELEEA